MGCWKQKRGEDGGGEGEEEGDADEEEVKKEKTCEIDQSGKSRVQRSQSIEKIWIRSISTYFYHISLKSFHFWPSQRLILQRLLALTQRRASLSKKKSAAFPFLLILISVMAFMHSAGSQRKPPRKCLFYRPVKPIPIAPVDASINSSFIPS